VAAALRLCINTPRGWLWAALAWFVAYAIYLLVIGPLLVRGRLAAAH
jgi:hypothetical protein